MGERRELKMSGAGCEAAFTYSTEDTQHHVWTSTDKFNFKDLDASTVEVLGSSAVFYVETTNNANAISLTVNSTPAFGSDDMLFELPEAYTKRFAKAFKHAVVLCGGKPSTF